MELEELLKRAKKVRGGRSREDDREFMIEKLDRAATQIISSFENAKNSKSNSDQHTILLDNRLTDKQLTQLEAEIRRLSYDSHMRDKKKYDYEFVEKFDNETGRLRFQVQPISENPLNKLQMYAGYLKFKNNPQFLNVEELKKIKYNSSNPYKFEIEKTFEESQDEKLAVIKRLETIDYIVGAPIRAMSAVAKYIDKKTSNFFDKYKYHPSGDIPLELREKIYSRK